MSHTKESKRQPSHAKKRKVRMDRIAAVLVPLLLIILLITLLSLYSCERDGKIHLFQSTTTTAPVATTTTAATSTEAATDSETSETESTDETASPANAETLSLPASSVAKGNLILINNEHSYSFPVGDSELKVLYEECNGCYSVSDMNVMLESETITQLNLMMEDFQAETGYTGMQVFSGYRSEEDQQSRYDSGSTTFAGGYSDYHSGRSFNLKINFGDGTSDYYNSEKYPSYDWISEHCTEYGFIVRYPEDKDSITGEESRSYTFRYVGVPHAMYMAEHNLCLEEYLEEIQNYTQDNPLEIDEGAYVVYYVPASTTGNTEVSVTAQYYSISGDNVGGFIVTEMISEE